MKVTGQTDTRQVIMECSQAEYNALLVLARVASGEAIPSYIYPDEGRIGSQSLAVIDIALINAIGEWVSIKDRANKLRNLADDIDHAIQVSEM